jgi:hypothetical protein
MKTTFVALGLTDKIAAFHKLLDAVQACLSITNSTRITQIRTDLRQSKIKLMIKIMKIDVADLREESLTKDGSHGYGINQKVLKIVQEVDLDLMIGMKNGKDQEIREEMVPDMAQEEIPEMKIGKVQDKVLVKVLEEAPEMKIGKVQDTVLVKVLEEAPEMKIGKVLDTVHVKVLDTVLVKVLEEAPEMKIGKVLDTALVRALDMAQVKVLEEVPEEMNGKVQDLALAKVLEEVLEEMSGEVLDMVHEMVLEMKLLNGNSSIIPLMKPDPSSEECLV